MMIHLIPLGPNISYFFVNLYLCHCFKCLRPDDPIVSICAVFLTAVLPERVDVVSPRQSSPICCEWNEQNPNVRKIRATLMRQGTNQASNSTPQFQSSFLKS